MTPNTNPSIKYIHSFPYFALSTPLVITNAQIVEKIKTKGI